MSSRSGGTSRRGNSTVAPTIAFASDRVRELMAKQYGRALPPDAVLAGLLGAVPGGRVEARNAFQQTTYGPGDAYRSTSRIVSPAVPGGRAVIDDQSYTRSSDGRPLLASSAPFLSSLRAQVEAADRTGGAVESLHMKVRAFTTDNIALVRAGFDAPMANVKHETWTSHRTGFADTRVTAARTVSELISTAAGARLWAREAMNPDLYFDLTPGSASRARLDAALRKRGLPGLTRI